MSARARTAEENVELARMLARPRIREAWLAAVREGHRLLVDPIKLLPPLGGPLPPARGVSKPTEP